MLQGLPSLSPTEASPWLARRDVPLPLPYSDESLTSPIPLAPAVPAATGTSSDGPKPPRKGFLFPTATAADTLTHPQSCWPTGQRVRGCGSGCSPRHRGGGRAEASRRWGWQRQGRLGGGTCFCGQDTLVLLQHHPRPSPPSGLQLGFSGLLPSVPGGLAAPPRGLLSQIQVGGVGEGRG